MIKSMTGYANADTTTPWGQVTCEVRSVNSRHLELSIRSPDEIRQFEPAIRQLVQAKVTRGKVEVNMRLRRGEGEESLSINQQVLTEYAKAAQNANSQFPNLNVEFARLLTLPGVMASQEVDSEGLQKAVLDLVRKTVDAFIDARQREGAKLKDVIVTRLDGIEAIAKDARSWIPAIREAQRARLMKRLGDVDVTIDPQRIEQELVIALTKLDVDEELDRLDSHIAEARRVVALDEAVGRRMDFLLQEFNREANTLGSKSVDSRTGNASVELKVLIDQIREQIQNIE